MYLPRNRTFWAVSVGHLTNDIFISMGIVMLTFLSATVLPMSLTQIGLAVSLNQILGALSQPFFGIRADKRGGRGIGTLGLAWVVGMLMLSLWVAVTTRDYTLMLIPFVLQSLGSGAVHPVGSLHAAEADPRRSATNVSYFFLMGQFGLATGPALLGLLLDSAHVDNLRIYTDALTLPPLTAYRTDFSGVYALSFLALPAIGFMATSIPLRVPPPKPLITEPRPAVSTSALPVTAMLILGALVVLRGLAQPGSVNFIPVLFQQKGWSPAEYGLITSSFWIASGVSGVIFGNLADRYDRRYVVLWSMVLSAPMFFLLPLTDGLVAFMLAVAAGGFSGGAHSIIVVLAQSLIPNSKGFASGAILGFIFGTGALGSLVIGSVSDVIGLGATFQWVAVAAVISGVLALFLPHKKRP